MSKPGNQLEGHNYDGIEELDNSLPRWWLNGFYLTILFAIGYLVYYEIGDGPSLQREYERAKDNYEIAQALQKSQVKPLSEDALKTIITEASRIPAGRAVFQERCISCHGALGQGGIGPNLTDEYWIHGNKLSDLLNVITTGVADKGMPPWGAILKPEEGYSVLAYIKSLGGSNPPGAKAPQGERFKE